MKIITFAGALRADSCNKKFAREAAHWLKELGAEVEFLDLKDFPVPVYDGDIETYSGIPEGTKALGAKIRVADAVVISTPEYNGSIPGVLKNVVDWLSREKEVSLAGKHLLLLAASPGAMGGIRALWHTRQPFEVIGMHVFPTMMSLPNAYQAFGTDGHLAEEKPRKQLQDLLGKFVAHVKR